MKLNIISIWLLIFCVIPSFVIAQTATVRGIVFDTDQQIIPGVSVQVLHSELGTATDKNGAYLLEIPARQEVTIQFSYIGMQDVRATMTLEPNADYEFHPVLKVDAEQIGTIVLRGNQRQSAEGIMSLTPETVRRIPGANAGVENLLKSLPGVSGNDELSTQYSVRGGNYDENLVYVNEIEVYRPFLIRSGQQEGLSFVNSDMTSQVDFSAGGFQAKYGDKLSSVLDITYRKPVQFAAKADVSLLGGQITAEGIDKSGRWTGIISARYRDNSLFVNAKQTETNYEPRFADIQAYSTYKASNKLELAFLGNISTNRYHYEPKTRQTNFGTLTDPKALLIYYEGNELDKYATYFGAFKATYVPNENYTAKLIASVYHTQEQEHFDILGQYRMGEVNSNIGGEDMGEVEYSEGIGSQLTHARNDLDALIVNIEHKGNFAIKENKWEYGVKYTHEDIRDRMNEFEVIDSAGFSIRPPILPGNTQPYDPYEEPLVPYTSVHARNNVQIDRISAYLQWSRKTYLGNNELWMNAGLRTHNWTVNAEEQNSHTQTVISPRAQIALKPDWEQDMLFRLSGGLYYQPPFYRELRNIEGEVQPDVKAQKAIHIVIGNEYSFDIWDRPFTLHSELYYKDLTDVNPYTLENVRIRYAADNIAKAYAYGVDLRLAGEFIPGTESWVSFGYLKTEENIENRGFIARPTDQRLKFAALFQDYVKAIPNLKMYLNLVYNTGLPGGTPSYADPYVYQTRLRDYTRADIGISYILIDKNNPDSKPNSLGIKDWSIGIEIFNIFDTFNSITNTYVRDVYTKTQYAIPNYLTPRIFNVRTTIEL